ncbi:MAG: hypothetical protein R3Y53_10045 [Bacillota bacterium]
MTSNHSSYNENNGSTNHKISGTAYFKQSIKQHYAAIALIVLTFCCTPLFQMFLAIDQAKFRIQRMVEQNGKVDAVGIANVMDNYILHVLTLDNEMMKSLLAGLGILVACVVFRYLHSKKQTDFYHSLPIKRSTLFWNQYLFGIVLVLPLYFIATGISFLYADMAMKVYGGISGLAAKEILITQIAYVLIFLLSYTTSAIANILVGNTIIGLILSGLLLLCFDWILTVKDYLVSCFLSQVTVNYYNFALTKHSPLYNLLSVRSHDLEFNFFDDVSDPRIYSYTDANDYVSMSELNMAFILYTLLVVVLIAAAYYLFLKRPSESAGNCLSFKISKPIFKYLGVVLVSITFGLFFYEWFRASSVALYGGMALFAVLFHCTVEIIYDFDFKSIFKNAKSIVGCFIIAAGVVLVFQYDVLAIDKKVPKPTAVESVRVTDSSRHNYTENLPGVRLDWVDAALPIADSEYIADVINLHTIANESDYAEALAEPSVFTTYIEYNLTNGGTLGRNVAITDDVIDSLSEIVNTDLYAEQHVLFFNEYFTQIEIMEIYAIDQKMNHGLISQAFPEENPVLDEFVEALLVDIKAHGLCPSEDIVYRIFGQADYRTIFDSMPNIGTVEPKPETEVVEIRADGEIQWKGENIRSLQPFYIYKEYTNAIAVLENNIEFSPIFTHENQADFYPSFKIYPEDGMYTSYRYFDNGNITLSEEEVDMIYASGSLFFDPYGRHNYHVENGVALNFDLGHTKEYQSAGHYDYGVQFWLGEDAVAYFDEKYGLF